MSAFLNQRLTNVGWDALSVALGGGRLTFFKMQAGSGTITNDGAIMGMTALVAPVCDIGITNYVIEGDGQITLFGNIASSTLDAGFTFRELGVFATIENPVVGLGGVPSGPNIQTIQSTPGPGVTSNPVVPNPPAGTALMYSYCNSYANSDYIPGKNETTDVVNTIQVTIKIDEAVVTINILQGQQLSVVNIGPPSVGAGPWSYTQANVAYMKRLVPGAAMLITEDTNTITISAKQLTADLDLYVANGNPDISPNFSTIQKAVDYLGQFLIPTTIRARVHVQAGTYVLSAGNWPRLNHPNSLNITIQGPQNATLHSNALVTITGSSSNWDVRIGGIADTSSVVVNGWVIVDNVNSVASANEGLITGFFYVVAKDATSVTYRVPYPKASFSMNTFSSLSVTPITAIISAPVNTYGFSASAYGIGLLQYIGIVAQATPTVSTSGVSISGPGNLKFVGAYGFNSAPVAANNLLCHGIAAWGESLVCTSCGVTNNQNGFTVGGGGKMTLCTCASSHSKQYGIWVDSGGLCYIGNGYSRSAGSLLYGIICANESGIMLLDSIPVGNMIVHKNDNWGVVVTGRASVIFGAQPTLNITGNVNGDVLCGAFGYVGSSARITGSRIFNLPVGTMSSQGGLIA